jgi:hypothetical protein
VTDTTAAETSPESQDDVQPSAAPAQVASAEGTSTGIWILYALGILAALVLAGSLVVVAIESAGSGGNGVDLHVSTLALAIWLALIIAAGGTFVWRRWGRAK